MIRFTAGGKTVSVYPGSGSGGPVVYLNTFADEGERVYRELQAESAPDFSFVTVSGLNWDHDMAPWDIPPVFPGKTACSGGADEYLELLTEKIMPRAEREIPGEILWRGIGGYSLAGLFAVYSLYQTEVFSEAASISGSLWFPGFREYVFSHEMKTAPKHVYFSLGDRESRTGNPCLKAVQEHTEEIEAFYRRRGINTVFQSNPGGHYKNTVKRTAAGILWLLDQQPSNYGKEPDRRQISLWNCVNLLM